MRKRDGEKVSGVVVVLSSPSLAKFFSFDPGGGSFDRSRSIVTGFFFCFRSRGRVSVWVLFLFTDREFGGFFFCF